VRQYEFFRFAKRRRRLRKRATGTFRNCGLTTDPTQSGTAPILPAVSASAVQVGFHEILALEQVARRVAAQE